MEAIGRTSGETAALLGFPAARLRALARAGVLQPTRGPRREYRFSFQDLAFLRSARSLLDARIPRRRVIRALRLLARQLPAGRRPSELQLASAGDRVVARDGDLVWSPENGQLWLDFSARRDDAPIAPLGRDSPSHDPGEWYRRGLELEPIDVEAAAAAYRRALALAPDHGGAHVNLGRLLQGGGNPAEAADQYRAALEAEPRNATAAFDLGTALEQLDRVDEAIEAYRSALNLDPLLADAHYNLSLLYQRKGFKVAALVHLRRYKALM